MNFLPILALLSLFAASGHAATCTINADDPCGVKSSSFDLCNYANTTQYIPECVTRATSYSQCECDFMNDNLCIRYQFELLVSSTFQCDADIRSNATCTSEVSAFRSECKTSSPSLPSSDKVSYCSDPCLESMEDWIVCVAKERYEDSWKAPAAFWNVTNAGFTLIRNGHCSDSKLVAAEPEEESTEAPAENTQSSNAAMHGLKVVGVVVMAVSAVYV